MTDTIAVIVAYNNSALTLQAVEALKSQSVDVNIIVWDNASSDDTLKVLENVEGITVHASPENLYWTPAINEALATYMTDEKFILWMNNDTVPMIHVVERLQNILTANPEIGMIAPATARIGGPQDVVNCETHEIAKAGGFIDRKMANLPPKRVAFVLGAIGMVSRKAWDEVGPLEEAMPLGADDHDYSIRVKHAGYQIWVAQNAFADHVGHASSGAGDGNTQWDAMGGPSWDYFNRKWAGYFATEEEAINCHWGGNYVPGFEVGTGWDAETYERRVTKGDIT